MKKSILVFILLLALLTACSNRTETSVDAPPQAYTQLDEGVWPVNAYTDGASRSSRHGRVGHDRRGTQSLQRRYRGYCRERV